MVTTRSQGTRTIAEVQHPGTSQSSPPLTTPWTLVVKGKPGKQKHVSFKPTIVQPKVAVTDSSQANSGEATPSPIEMVRPYIKGLERGSVLIDVTYIKDLSVLENTLKKFNEEAAKAGTYNEFIGYPEVIRTYLGHRFIETMWLTQSAGYKAILNDGVFLPDGTFVKGFPSYPNDAQIVHVKLENLPYLPSKLVMQDMARIFSCYGTILDLGVNEQNGVYHGRGYVTLNLTKPTPSGDQESLPETSQSFAPLTRVIPWEEDDGYYRLVLAQWDSMPDFCRTCQKPGHCRADCPDYKQHLQCFNCNEHGHISRNCPRYSSSNKVRVVEQTTKQSAPTSRSGRKSPSKKDPPPVSGVVVLPSPEQAGKPAPNADTEMPYQNPSPPATVASGLEQAKLPHTGPDVTMTEAESKTTEEVASTHASNSGSTSVQSINATQQEVQPSTLNSKLPLNKNQTPGTDQPFSPIVEKTQDHNVMNNGDGNSPTPPKTSRAQEFDSDEFLNKTLKTSVSSDVSKERQLLNEEQHRIRDAKTKAMADKIAASSVTTPTIQ